MADIGNNGPEGAADEMVDFWGWLDRIPALIGLLSFAALAASIVHDWGLFTALGTSFGKMPTTLTYHIRSALNIVHWGVYFLMMFFVKYIIGDLSPPKEGSIEPQFARSLFVTSLIACGGFAFLIYSSLSVLDANNTAEAMHLLVILTAWLVFCVVIIVRPKKIPNNVHPNALVSMTAIPPFLCLIIILGISEATAITFSSDSKYYVFEMTDPKREKKGILVRSFDNHWLIWDPCVNSNNIRLLNMDYVVSQQQADIPEKDCPPKNLSSEEKDSSQTTTEP